MRTRCSRPSSLEGEYRQVQKIQCALLYLKMLKVKHQCLSVLVVSIMALENKTFFNFL